MLGFGAWAPFEDAVQGGPGVPPVVLPAEEFGDVPGYRIDPALVLGPTQLLDQVLREADRKLLRCGHTLVIPVGDHRLNLIGTAGGVLTGMDDRVGAAAATART